MQHDLINLLKKIKIKKKIKSMSIHEPSINKTDLYYINKAIKSKNVAVGNFINQFENKLSKITNSKYVVLVSSGTAALHLACKFLKISEKDEVLIPNINFISSTNSVIQCGGHPHFIDISKKTLGVDVLKLENYIKKIGIIKNNKLYNKYSKRHIKAIIPTHTFGHPCEIDKIEQICKKYNIFCIEDAAEAIGSFYKKKHLGTFSKIGILSFNGNKIITSGGGGAIITSSKKIEKEIRGLSNHNKVNHAWKYNYNGIGFNYKMPNLNAALGYSQINKLKYLVKKHRELYSYYKKILKGVKSGYLFSEPAKARSNYWLQTFILHKSDLNLKNKILNESNKLGINTRPAWILMNSVNHLKKYPKMDLKNSEEMFKKIINLPSSINL